MQIEFQGAAQTVTGSMHLLRVNGSLILLDCGMYQGRREEAEKRNKTFPFDPKSINALIVSHAHIDHTGNIPNFVKQGYSGPIYCTSATYDLCQIMLADSAHIQERDAEFVTKQRKKKGEPPVTPLYTVEDARAAMKLFRRLPYDKSFDVLPGVSAIFTDAGHILGSASIKVTVKENGTTKTVGFTGDIGRWDMPIINDPAFMGNVEHLISESTYGGILHDPPTDMEHQILEVITRTANRGGKIIIPAFSVGRTQDLVYAFNILRQKGILPNIPIYIDSPLAVNATDIFRRHPECYDEDIKEFLLNNEDPFGMKQLHYVRLVEESKRLNDFKGSCIIIAASGMCEAGRIRHHLASNIENPKNTILIVGYQAEHTLGRKLVDQWEEVRIFGELFKRKAEVVVINSLSAHADGNELLKYIGKFDKKQLQKIYLVHGEITRMQKLQTGLKEQGLGNAEIPVRGQKFEI